ncbi:SAM-dependent methyltransferase [Myxacorys almedinensis]|uniref:SAM-dependent methyltransferase n=1 Tax=Myxacorys almedinensis A TaxID=2690445 RepID=A0A8J8CPI5_9CYAN|nr:SAM-dependent methyltransferase [Myxacorys almedinensis]NDJ19517.1 SAM-dependent methyltransferase [Myxacorys almedinensis A]
MGLRLEQVVPWGRSWAEYCQMFDLTMDDLERTILDVAGGPASFNAEMAGQGRSVISCDPIYQFSAAEIGRRIEETSPVIIEKLETSRDQFVWAGVRSPEQLVATRMAAMRQFLDDFPTGLQQQRYWADALPHLPFEVQQFDLALSSHLLFTYSDQLSLEFHRVSVLELCRVAGEVRIFPLLINMTGERSPFVSPVIEAVRSQGHRVEICAVPYEFQRGGNEMIKIISCAQP